MNRTAAVAVHWAQVHHHHRVLPLSQLWPLKCLQCNELPLPFCLRLAGCYLMNLRGCLCLRSLSLFPSLSAHELAPVDQWSSDISDIDHLGLAAILPIGSFGACVLFLSLALSTTVDLISLLSLEALSFVLPLLLHHHLPISPFIGTVNRTDYLVIFLPLLPLINCVCVLSAVYCLLAAASEWVKWNWPWQWLPQRRN